MLKYIYFHFCVLVVFRALLLQLGVGNKFKLFNAQGALLESGQTLEQFMSH